MKKRKNIIIINLCLILLLIFPNITLANITLTRPEYDILSIPNISINNKTPIKIAIIDSGIINNKYLHSYTITGYNFLENNNDYTDEHGHGTKVTSIIVDLAKETNLNIELFPLKVVNKEGRSSTNNVIKAINYSIEQKVDVINISMTNKNDTIELKNAIQNAQMNNIIIVAGVGNNGENVELYPASYENVISVGSIAQNKNISWFSNYNDKISIVAPGENITTMELDGSYGLHGGTSFSTAFVTFEVALLKIKYPELNNDDIIKVIKETAIDMGELDKDNYYGYGIINYNNAINYAYEALKKYKKWETALDIPANKPWTIVFNDLVKSTGNISIIDEYYNNLSIDSQINENKVTIKPLQNYKSNEIYSLIIENTISSKNIDLKENVKMKFKTLNSTKIMNYQNVNEYISMPIWD
ncbi:MAG: S8 family serine peptidase [Bacilli bacterium]|nr:S8 family serine peptidase [Tissierellia bacterium]MDD4706587.1 S8 family serine peptidase [Bacilli bacterium]